MALVLRLRLRALEACQVGRRSARICREAHQIDELRFLQKNFDGARLAWTAPCRLLCISSPGGPPARQEM